MDYPSAERLPDAEEVQPEFYEKDKGSAGIHGQIFEHKFCALLFLRATNKGYKFKLASNVKELGAFHDVDVEYRDATSRKSHIFLKLESKQRRLITTSHLKSKDGDFSLRKYYKSYIQIENKFNSSEEGVKIDGRIDDSLFIIYTNADFGQDLKCNKGAEVGEEEFLMTGGSVLQFDEEEHKTIYEDLQELPKHREFLSRLRILYCQAEEKEMDCHIKPELQQSLLLPDTELELAYTCFLDFMKDWWQNSNFFLKETNCKEYDPLRKTSEKVRTTLLAKILEQRKCELDELNIKYKESVITDMKQLIQPHKAVLILAPGRSTTLTAAKIHQMLSATTHIILNLQQLLRYKSAIMSAWKHKFKVMVLERESCDEDFQDVFNGMSVLLNECDEQKFIFISSRKGNIQQISALRSTFSTQLTERYDDWRVTDIDTESRKFFLQKKVYFQGAEVKLSNIVKEHDVEMLNALDCDSMSRLLENEKPSIGIPIEDTVEYYIDRTLQCRRDMKPRFQIQGQMQHALNGDILQESQDIRSHREENVKKSDTPKGWEPRTLLDGGDRLILVADEPGMGKSTLLTHLAKETRKSHPETWIVRVNLNNCTRILQDIKTNISDEEGAIRLLTEAAQILQIDGVQLEEHLFYYSYNSTGNMAVLIDGVDEVSPHYTEEVTQILKILYKTKIKKIWVTSRNSVKGHLEHELQCQSHSLVPFSEEDQKRFLVKFWSKKCVVVPRDHLENLAHRVVELSIKHLRDGEKNFMGLPLQSMLLAEMSEENLKHSSTSATVDLPEYINLVMLYDFYVIKKWNIYLSDGGNIEDTDGKGNTIAHFAVANENHDILKFLSKQNANLDVQNSDGDTPLLQAVREGRNRIVQYLVDENLDINTQGNDGMRPLDVAVLKGNMEITRLLLERNARSCKAGMHIIAAARFGFLDLLQGFVDTGEDINVKTEDGESPLHVACKSGQVATVQYLSEHGALLDLQDNSGNTALHVAVSNGHLDVIRVLVPKGANLALSNASGSTALHIAAKRGYMHVVQFLADSFAPIDMLNAKKQTALLVATAEGHERIVRFLIEQGAEIGVKDIEGKTALDIATEKGYGEIKQLLKDRAEGRMLVCSISHTDLHTVAEGGHFEDLKGTANEFGWTPLNIAVYKGQLEKVTELLNQGASVDIANEDGWTALKTAAFRGHVDIVRVLLSRGASVEYAGKYGWTPLNTAAYGGHVEIVREFLNHGASVETANEKGWTPLNTAAYGGHVEVVRELLKHDANVETAYEKGWTPLKNAALRGHVEVVRELVGRHAIVDIADKNGWTPLHTAAYRGHLEVVRELLNHGACVDITNNYGETPLYKASFNGHVEVVRELLKHGASVDIANNFGWTPLKAAISNGHEEVIRELQKHGASSGHT